MQQMSQSMRDAHAMMRIEAQALSVNTHNEESARRDLAARMQPVYSDADTSSAAEARARQLARGFRIHDKQMQQ
jgi:ATPase subunit of ABC transporter with duplicated ATPase domains